MISMGEIVRNYILMQLEYTFKYAYRISVYQNSASTAPVDFFINARIVQTIVN